MMIKKDFQKPSNWLQRIRTSPLLVPLSIFGVSLLIYAYIGWIGSYVIEIYIYDDGLARISQALIVFYSRDPHLAAIGFVWMPLPVLSNLPLVLLLKPFNLILFVGPLMSAIYSAFALTQLNEILKYFQLRTHWRILWIVLFGIHPIIVQNATMGFSEAPFLAFLFAAINNLFSWLKNHKTNHIIMAGIYSTLALFCRYEAIFLIIALCIVMMLDWLRTENHFSPSFLEANLITFLVPSLYGLMFWMFTNWLIMGNPIHFLVGKGSTLTTPDTARLVGPTHPFYYAYDSLSGSFSLLIKEAVTLAPILLVATLLLGMVIVLKKRWFEIGYLIIGWSILAFTFFTAYRGSLPPFSRYFFWVVPAGILIAGALHRFSENKLFRNFVAVGTSIVMIFTILGLTSHAFGLFPEHTPQRLLGAFLVPAEVEDVHTVQGWLDEYKEVALFLNKQPPGHMTILDNAIGNPIDLFLERPYEIVRTTDTDFFPILRSIIDNVDQVLIPEPTFDAIGRSDILNYYPGMYEGKLKWAKLIHEFPGSHHWRLFQITSP